MELINNSLFIYREERFFISIDIMCEGKSYTWGTTFIQKPYYDENKKPYLIKERDYKPWSNDVKWSDLKSSKKRKMKKLINLYFDNLFIQWKAGMVCFKMNDQNVLEYTVPRLA
jgi:hypothetical protein